MSWGLPIPRLAELLAQPKATESDTEAKPEGADDE